MTRDEDAALADMCESQGIEFRRRPMQPGFVAVGPAEHLQVGRIVVYRRASDLALKRYRLERMLWEGLGEDGALRRVFETAYIRRSEAHPIGRCNRCRMSKRTNKMRCSGTGFHCSPVLAVTGVGRTG